jgi:bla regulator protein BlaR1
VQPLFGTLTISADFNAVAVRISPAGRSGRILAARHDRCAAGGGEAAFDPAPVAAAGPDWLALAACGLWLAGAALWFGWQMVRYRLFVAQRAAMARRIFRRALGVEVFASDRRRRADRVRRRPPPHLPAARLPRSLFTSGERRQALLHEGAHHDRQAICWRMWWRSGSSSLHWWNPLAHIAYRCFRADQELACDATVLADAAPDQLYAYGSALVKSTVGRAPAAACAFNRTDEIKRRLTMIKRGRLGFGRRSAGVALAVAATVTRGWLPRRRAAMRRGVGSSPQSRRLPLPVATAADGTFAPVKVKPGKSRGDGRSRSNMPAPRGASARTAGSNPRPARRPERLRRRPCRSRRSIIGRTGRSRLERRPETQADGSGRSGAGPRRRPCPRQRAGAAGQGAGRIAIGGRQSGIGSRRRDRALRHRDTMRVSNVRVMVANSLNQARAELASACAAKGTPVSAGERDWGKLAVCDKAAFNAQVIRSMEEARTEIVRDQRHGRVTAAPRRSTRSTARSPG